MIRPDFYDNFSCIASACRHSCCRGWEIDIDPDTAGYYEEFPGDFGDEIRRNIFYDEEGCHFKLIEENCPFLDKDGLCRMIKTQGEDVLCDICALHPRFYFDLSHQEFEGLGLCCEAVCSLLLSSRDTLLFINDEDDRRRSISDFLPEAENLIYTPRPETEYYREILRIYGTMEPIDEAWTSELANLSDSLTSLVSVSLSQKENCDIKVWQRIFDYILYRQLPLVSEYGIERVLSYAHTATEFIFMTNALWGDTNERVRRWSEEVEYSTENVELAVYRQ